jgi:hypothetical protein
MLAAFQIPPRRLTLDPGREYKFAGLGRAASYLYAAVQGRRIRQKSTSKRATVWFGLAKLH